MRAWNVVSTRRQLLLALTAIALPGVARAGDFSPMPARQAVYHIQDSKEQAARSLLYINNHLRSDPTVRITVVGHAGGIDFLLRDAVGKSDVPYEPALHDLMKTGRVRFVACGTTLLSRNITRDALVSGVDIVDSGVATIADLQLQQHAAYIRP